jgi:hypothetical protein
MRRSLLVALLGLSLGGCQGPLRPSDITYEVTGPGLRANVVYNTAYGASKATNVPLPWAFAFSAEPRDLLFVSAEIVRGNGSVTVTIRKGTQSLRTATATGAAAIATASSPLE